jgi:hypothetical protein
MRVERRNILLFHAVFLLWLWRSFIANIEFTYITIEKPTLHMEKNPRVSLDIHQTESNLTYDSDRNASFIFKCVIF